MKKIDFEQKGQFYGKNKGGKKKSIRHYVGSFEKFQLKIEIKSIQVGQILATQ